MLSFGLITFASMPDLPRGHGIMLERALRLLF